MEVPWDIKKKDEIWLSYITKAPTPTENPQNRKEKKQKRHNKY